MVGLVVSAEYKWKDGVKNEMKGSKKKGGLTTALNLAIKKRFSLTANLTI
jgi:hypothetical protein